MSATPMVSVIMIFLDEERFLADAVESVLAQTCPHWELLLCDDGSTDGSAAIAQDYAARDPERIRYLTHPGGENRGMSETRNLGLAESRGEYVAFLDGDDAWLPAKLERQVAVLRANPGVDAVCARTLYWHGWSGLAEDTELDRFSRLVGPADRPSSGKAVLNRILRGAVEAITTCSVLIRRDAVVRAGGFEARFRGLFEDQAFFAKLLVDHDIYIMDECLDLYRQHPDSCCAVATRTMEDLFTQRAAFLRWLQDWLQQHGAPVAVQRTVARELLLHRFPTLVEGRRSVRERLRNVQGGLINRAFAVARRVVPPRLREPLWRRFGGQRRNERQIAAAAAGGINSTRSQPTAG